MTMPVYMPLEPTAASHARLSTPWLITIVDMMTILVAFFILMFSMTDIDMARFKPIADSYSSAFGPPSTAAAQRLPKIATVPGDNLSYLEVTLRAAFARSPSLRDVEFRATPQYLILSLPGEGPFAAGSSGFTASSRGRVFDLGGVLDNLHNRIAVVGTASIGRDADAAPAWRLAIERADAMAAAFSSAGYSKEITILGRSGDATDVAAAMGQVEIWIMPERPAQ